MAASAYSSLRDFIDRLEHEGRLVRVAEPVSTRLEMTEIQTRLLAERAQAGGLAPHAPGDPLDGAEQIGEHRDG